MVKTVADSVAEVDAAVMVFEPYGEFTPQEQGLMEDIRAKRLPTIGVVNKTDVLRRPADGAARMAQLEAAGVFAKVLCVSAREGSGCEELLAAIEALWKARIISRMTPIPICRRRPLWRK